MLTACTPAVGDKLKTFTPQQFTNVTEVEILVRGGQITVTQTDSGQVEMTGKTAQDIVIQQNRGKVTVESGVGAVDLQVALPTGTKLGIDSFNADVGISNFTGAVRVNSEAGDITITNYKGRGQFRSGRGDILVADSQGEITLLGEHGLLQFRQAHGTLSATTIMGTVQYTGAPGAGENLWLETDHGPVEINLQPESNLTLTTNTASGKVICVASALFDGPEYCSGQAGPGEADFGIRTVSGNITIRAIP